MFMTRFRAFGVNFILISSLVTVRAGRNDPFVGWTMAWRVNALMLLHAYIHMYLHNTTTTVLIKIIFYYYIFYISLIVFHLSDKVCYNKITESYYETAETQHCGGSG